MKKNSSQKRRFSKLFSFTWTFRNSGTSSTTDFSLVEKKSFSKKEIFKIIFVHMNVQNFRNIFNNRDFRVPLPNEESSMCIRYMRIQHYTCHSRTHLLKHGIILAYLWPWGAVWPISLSIVIKFLKSDARTYYFYRL